MANLARWIRHNQGMTVAVAVAIIITLWTFGCESKVSSLIEPSKKVTAAELKLEIDQESMRLQGELDALVKRAEVKKAELVRQDAIKQKIMDFALLAGEAGTINPSGLIGLVVSVLGIGAVVDNRIKDKVIKNRPLKG